MSRCSAAALCAGIAVHVSYIIGNMTPIARADLAESYNALNIPGNDVLTEVYAVAALARAESNLEFSWSGEASGVIGFEDAISVESGDPVVLYQLLKSDCPWRIESSMRGRCKFMDYVDVSIGGGALAGFPLILENGKPAFQ